MKTLISLILITSLILSCSPNDSNSTELDSDNFNDKDERINRIEKEVKLYSQISDAEFELFNVNGFSNQRTGVPGASSWSYKFAVKVSPNEIDNWTDGFTKTDSMKSNIGWTEDIVESRKNNWTTKSNPEFYYRKGESVEMILYREEGIIFKKVMKE